MKLYLPLNAPKVIWGVTPKQVELGPELPAAGQESLHHQLFSFVTQAVAVSQDDR